MSTKITVNEEFKLPQMMIESPNVVDVQLSLDESDLKINVDGYTVLHISKIDVLEIN